MAKFDAATAVEELEYDFSKYGGPIGVTPEPSTEGLERFMDEIRVLMVKFREIRNKAKTQDAKAPEADVEPDGEEDLAMEAAELVELDEMRGAAKQLLGTMKDVISDLTQQQPSREDLDTLPQRVFLAYLTWLIEQLKPKAITPGTRA